MVRMCPALSKRVKILTAQKRIVYTPTNSFYQVLSAEAYSKHGFNIHGVVFDELHTQPNRKLFDVMTKGSGDARMQPLYFLITTAGSDTNSICYEVHSKAKDIIEGRKHDSTFYPVIYGADESEDWTDPKVWKKANPSLDKTIGMDKVVAACNSAKETPGEENAFRQLRLNQWVKQAVRWMPMEKWDKCKVSFDEDDLSGRVCYGGLDLSSTTDITAFVLVFPPTDDDENYYVLPYFWLPEDTLPMRVRRDHVPYDLWERQGFLLTTEGNVVHYGFIENFIDELGKKFNIKEIAFDRWGAVQMSQNLEDLGFTLVQFGQGYREDSPTLSEKHFSISTRAGGSVFSSVIFITSTMRSLYSIALWITVLKNVFLSSAHSKVKDNHWKKFEKCSFVRSGCSDGVDSISLFCCSNSASLFCSASELGQAIRAATAPWICFSTSDSILSRLGVPSVRVTYKLYSRSASTSTRSFVK